MQKELTQDAKVKLAKEIQSVFKQPIKNTEKLKMLDRIVLRVTTEQKQAYSKLSKEKKMPLSRLIRNSMNLTIKTNTLQPKKTEAELKADFLKFQNFLKSL